MKSRVYQSVCLQEGCIGYAPGNPPACITSINIPEGIECPKVN